MTDSNGFPVIKIKGAVIRPLRIMRTLIGLGFLARVLFWPSHNPLEMGMNIGVALVCIDVKLFGVMFHRRNRL